MHDTSWRNERKSTKCHTDNKIYVLNNNRFPVWQMWSTRKQCYHLFVNAGFSLDRSHILSFNTPSIMICKRFNKALSCLMLYHLSPVSIHYTDVIMSPMASQIAGVSNIYSNVYSGADQRKHQPRVTGFCGGNSPITGGFPAQRASNAENISIWWRHLNFKMDFLNW